MIVDVADKCFIPGGKLDIFYNVTETIVILLDIKTTYNKRRQPTRETEELCVDG